jgi:hypothetical protein
MRLAMSVDSSYKVIKVLDTKQIKERAYINKGMSEDENNHTCQAITAASAGVPGRMVKWSLPSFSILNPVKD